MQKLGGFPVNSKLTVSTINVFFAGLPRVLATVHAYRYARAAMECTCTGSVVHTGMAIHT